MVAQIIELSPEQNKLGIPAEVMNGLLPEDRTVVEGLYGLLRKGSAEAREELLECMDEIHCPAQSSLLELIEERDPNWRDLIRGLRPHT